MTETPPQAEEFKPDPNRSSAENEANKAEWEKEQAKKKAAEETPEVKAAREKADKDKADADAKAKANDTKATPFKAEEIKLPEGFEIDEAVRNDFVKLVNDEGIPRSAVEKLVALQANAMKAASEAGSKLFADMQTQWQTQAKADPTIGGDKLAGVLSGISKLIDQADAPDKVRELMDTTGFGNHPEAIKWLHKLVPMFTEPGAAPSGKPNTPERSAAQKIYDGK